MQHGDTTGKRLARRERTIIRLWLALPCLSILLGAPFMILFLLGSWGPETTTNVRRYREIRSKWHDGLADHFPPAIPADATNVRLHYEVGIFQGGDSFHVRMTLPTARAAEIADNFTATASRKFSDEFKPSDIPPVWPGPFPDYFTIYILRADPYAPHYWNHGSMSGAAVSKSTNEVVYWCAKW